MKKRNLLVVGILLAVIVLIAVIAVKLPQSRTIEADAPAVTVSEAVTEEPRVTEAPSAQPSADAQPTETPGTTEAPSVQPSADAQPTEVPKVEAYLIITVQGNIYEPLPLTGEGTFTIRQDETTFNTVHITPTSMWMEHSSCDNQDCVEQGVVSLENMTQRVLYTMVICLPNQVSLELHTPETLMDVFGLTP